MEWLRPKAEKIKLLATGRIGKRSDQYGNGRVSSMMESSLRTLRPLRGLCVEMLYDKSPRLNGPTTHQAATVSQLRTPSWPNP